MVTEGEDKLALILLLDPGQKSFGLHTGQGVCTCGFKHDGFLDIRQQSLMVSITFTTINNLQY